MWTIYFHYEKLNHSMAHIDWKPITDPGLQLLEAVASFDITWCDKILTQYEAEHRQVYHSQPQTLKQASTIVKVENKDNAPPPLYAAVVDLINNTRDEDGYTPMAIAFQSPEEHGAIPMIEFLLSKGGDVRQIPGRVFDRLDFDRTTIAGGQFVTGLDFHKATRKESLLVPLWEQEKASTRVLPEPFATAKPTDIEKQRFLQEDRERGEIFYRRGTKRFQQEPLQHNTTTMYK